MSDTSPTEAEEIEILTKEAYISPTPQQPRSKALILKKAQRLFPRCTGFDVVPIIKGVSGNVLLTALTYLIDKHLFKDATMKKAPKLGYFLLSYLSTIFLLRGHETKTTGVCYRLVWGCNIALSVCGLGFILGRPVMVSTAVAFIGLDQTLWYLDILSYSLRQKWLFGVAGYLSYPEQTLVRKCTGLHHLWFLPLAMYGLLRVSNSHLYSAGFPISFLIGFASMAYARAFIPLYFWNPVTDRVHVALKNRQQEKAAKLKLKRELQLKQQLKQNTVNHRGATATATANANTRIENESHAYHNLVHSFDDNDHGDNNDGDGDIGGSKYYYTEYCNVNCGHEFYKSVPWAFVHYWDQEPFYIYLPIIATMMQCMNLLPFALNTFVSNRFADDNSDGYIKNGIKRIQSAAKIHSIKLF